MLYCKYHRALMNPTAAAKPLHLVNILYLSLVWPVFPPLLLMRLKVRQQYVGNILEVMA